MNVKPPDGWERTKRYDASSRRRAATRKPNEVIKPEFNQLAEQAAA